MAVFIEVTTDAFENNFQERGDNMAASNRRAGASRVRRPLRGLEIKEDTFAIMKVIRSDGSDIPLFDSGTESGSTTDYANFILQSVQEARMEKHQIVDTFGESYIFFFGEAPRFLDVQVVLLNSNDFNWEAEWWANYNLYLRGTRSVELGARTYLFYDDNIVEGYMLQAQAVKTSDQPLMVMLSFKLFVTNYRNISFVGNPDFPIRSSVVLPPGTPSLREAMNGEQLNAFVADSTGADANGFATGGFDLSSGGPLRGKYTDNLDEFTAPLDNNKKDPYAGFIDRIEKEYQESKDLLTQIIDKMTALGADVNNSNFMQSMGLGPYFSFRKGIGIGSGSGYSSRSGFGAHASLNVNGRRITSIDSLKRSLQSSVRASANLSLRGGLNARLGAGNYYSGNSRYLSALSTDPNTYTSSPNGMAAASAISSSNTARGMAIASAGASYGGGSGTGASTYVGGKASAFAIASYDGDLDPTASATATASASKGF